MLSIKVSCPHVGGNMNFWTTDFGKLRAHLAKGEFADLDDFPKGAYIMLLAADGHVYEIMVFDSKKAHIGIRSPTERFPGTRAGTLIGAELPGGITDMKKLRIGYGIRVSTTRELIITEKIVRIDLPEEPSVAKKFLLDTEGVYATMTAGR